MTFDIKPFLIFLFLILALKSIFGIEGVVPEPRKFPPDSEIKDDKVVTPVELESIFKEPFVDFIKGKYKPHVVFGEIGSNHNLDLYASSGVNSNRGELEFKGTRNSIKFKDMKLTGKGHYILPTYKNFSVGVHSDFIYSKVNEVRFFKPAVGAFTSGLEGWYLTPEMFGKFKINTRLGEFKNSRKASNFSRYWGSSQVGFYLPGDRTIKLSIKGEKATYADLANRVLGARVSFLKTNVGFKFDMGLNINKSYQKLIGAPFVRVTAQSERSHLYAGYRRSLSVNNYASFCEWNPIYELDSSQFPAREEHRVLFGSRFNLPCHLWSGITLNFKRQRGLLTPFLDNGLVKSKLRNVNHLAVTFEFAYRDYNQLTFQYDYLRSFDGKRIPFQRNWILTDTVSVSPFDGLSLKLWGQYLGEEFVSQGIDALDSYLTGGFEVNYAWRDLEFFGKGINILNRRYEYFPRKFADGSKGIVGVRYQR